MRLYRYIISRFLLALIKVQLSIMALVLLLVATAELRFLSEKDVGLADSIWLILISMPKTLALTFPLVLMLASLFTFLGLARTSELVIVRASGISALKMLMAPVITAAIIGVISVAVFNPILATTIRNAEETHVELSGKRTTQTSMSSDGLWLRQTTPDSQFVIQARSSNRSGTILFAVRFHEYTSSGVLKRRIESPRVELRPGEWNLTSATQWIFVPDGEERIEIIPPADLSLATDLTSERIVASFANPETLSIWRIPAFIDQLELSGFSSVRHRVFLQAQLATPLMLVAMVLIGAAFSLRHARFGNTGVRALLAVLAGFLLFALKNVAESLGEAQEVPIVLATWAPPAAAALLALAYILHLEDG